MGRPSYRVVLVLLPFLCAALPIPAAADRLLVPGGAPSLRRVTGIPDHVPDSMLLSEAARAWFGVREAVPSDAHHAGELLDYLTTSTEPLEPGPWLPVSTATWMRLLQVKAPGEIAPALVRNRNAMLLYRGLAGLDDRTAAWLDTQPDLLSAILARTAPAFATVGPWLSVTPAGVAVPGGADAAAEWRELVGASPSEPARFIKALLEKDNSRIAWMFSVISALDPRRAAFALGPRGRNLRPLAGYFVNAAPEWNMLDRAFSRPPFDPSIALALVTPGADGSLAGSEEFWRGVFKEESSRPNAETKPLTAPAFVGLLFEEPLQAHARWEEFAIGQRILRDGQPGRETWAALNAALRFPAMALTLERMGALRPALLQKMADAAARLTRIDPDGRRGDLVAWQAAFVTIERASLNGGISHAEAESALTSLAALPLTSPRRELTSWFMDVWLEGLLSRPGAPTDAEAALLRAMAGDVDALRTDQASEFTWEDLPYVLAAEHRAFVRMQEARSAQNGPTLTDARIAWKGPRQELADACKRLEAGEDPAIASAAKRVATALSKNDPERLERERRDLADTLLYGVLPLIPYVPQQAASDVPSLGSDVALRHEVGPPSAIARGTEARHRAAWQLAVPVAFEGKPWHLAGSLLSLDIPLSGWYLRTNGDAPMATPMIEDPDVYSLALAAVLGTRDEIERLAASLGAIETGRERIRALPDLDAAAALLRTRGIDPWRVRALTFGAASGSDVADRLTPSEAWRTGLDGPVPVVPGMALDGCPCLGEAPFAPMFAEGRPSNGLIGALVPGLPLRIVTFLKSRGLPLALYRPLAGGVAFDVIHTANGIRTDDLLALDVAAARITDARLEEHVLALIADGTLVAPPEAGR